jgi:hypothetical protein
MSKRQRDGAVPDAANRGAERAAKVSRRGSDADVSIRASATGVGANTVLASIEPVSLPSIQPSVLMERGIGAPLWSDRRNPSISPAAHLLSDVEPAGLEKYEKLHKVRYG